MLNAILMVNITDVSWNIIQFGYALLIFIDSWEKHKSQANDLLGIQITIQGALTMQQLLKYEISSTSGMKYKLKNIISATNLANGLLRFLGYLPLIFLIIGGLIFIAIEYKVLTNAIRGSFYHYFFYAGTTLLIVYLILKFSFKISNYLIDLHPSYRGKPFLKVLFNIFPLW